MEKDIMGVDNLTENQRKTSIRFFDSNPVRSVWDEESSTWWLCAADVVSAVVETSNPEYIGQL